MQGAQNSAASCLPSLLVLVILAAVQPPLHASPDQDGQTEVLMPSHSSLPTKQVLAILSLLFRFRLATPLPFPLSEQETVLPNLFSVCAGAGHPGAAVPLPAGVVRGCRCAPRRRS